MHRKQISKEGTAADRWSRGYSRSTIVLRLIKKAERECLKRIWHAFNEKRSPNVPRVLVIGSEYFYIFYRRTIQAPVQLFPVGVHVKTGSRFFRYRPKCNARNPPLRSCRRPMVKEKKWKKKKEKRVERNKEEAQREREKSAREENACSGSAKQQRVAAYSSCAYLRGVTGDLLPMGHAGYFRVPLHRIIVPGGAAPNCPSSFTRFASLFP